MVEAVRENEIQSLGVIMEHIIIIIRTTVKIERTTSTIIIITSTATIEIEKVWGDNYRSIRSSVRLTL